MFALSSYTLVYNVYTMPHLQHYAKTLLTQHGDMHLLQFEPKIGTKKIKIYDFFMATYPNISRFYVHQSSYRRVKCSHVQ